MPLEGACAHAEWRLRRPAWTWRLLMDNRCCSATMVDIKDWAVFWGDDAGLSRTSLGEGQCPLSSSRGVSSGASTTAQLWAVGRAERRRHFFRAAISSRTWVRRVSTSPLRFPASAAFMVSSARAFSVAARASARAFSSSGTLSALV